MNQGRYEVVVLRPTMVFFAFLASQLTEEQLPNLKTLQTDNTAYVIPNHHSDKDTLKELERHYSRMFRYEISRWLGENARNPIEDSALDFLCCFKLELHNHIVLMEPSIKSAHQLLTIKPRSVLLNWLKSAIEDDEDLEDIVEQVTLSHLVENATVLAKNFATLKEIKPFLELHYQPIFKAAMSRMSGQARLWPEVNSYGAFSQYFAVDIHTKLKHLI